jgi:16S rRNA (guanine527-N7)-methyltransferase
MFHVKQGFTAEQFFAEVPVSRETADKLRLYADLLVKWQARINLVGAATLPDLWRRHMLDSAQLFPLLPAGPTLDLGSGAGFPGLVLAILRGSGDPVHLVESDARKCAFLREVARLTAAPAIIHHGRIESLSPFAVTAVTARALAPLASLLALASPFLGPHTQCLFLKGERLEDELTQAGKDWKMTVDRRPSRSDPNGIILIVKEVHRGRDQG